MFSFSFRKRVRSYTVKFMYRVPKNAANIISEFKATICPPPVKLKRETIMLNTKKTNFMFWLFLIVTLVISACDKMEENTYQPVFTSENTPQLTEYIVGIHPLHNPQRLMELYNPIVDYMNSHIPEAHFTLEASRDYEEFENIIKC
jgi:hypothetical protein